MSACRAWYRRGVERSPFLYMMGAWALATVLMILVVLAFYLWAFAGAPLP